MRDIPGETKGHFQDFSKFCFGAKNVSKKVLGLNIGDFGPKKLQRIYKRRQKVLNNRENHKHTEFKMSEAFEKWSLVSPG
tara:strand:+ start:101 stop:340 length:240 start_codon:yes stop_codon:yes gene_type:complete